MNKFVQIVIVLLSLMLLLGAGCTDRGTNTPVTPKEKLVESWGVWPEGDHVFTEHPDYPYPQSLRQLRFQIRNRNGIQDIGVYIPPEAMEEGRPVPLLVLLPPMYESKSFYLDHGLLELVEEMTANGEIQPMVIAALGTDQLFGGYFFGNSFPAGFYDEIISHPDTTALVSWLVNSIPWIIDSPDKRGIGGVGMGAYGAFRAVLKNPDMFSSISVADGPLDFDGADGSSGLMNLFDDALAEQGLDESTFKSFDSSRAWPISSMFISGALAFSPNDTLLDYDIRTLAGGTADTVEIDTSYRRSDNGGDTTTLIRGVVKQDMGDWDFYLPFDGTGSAYGWVWDLWLENDLERIHDDAGASPLAGINMWIGTSPDAHYGFHDMTESWISTLEDNGYTPEVYNYGGYDGKPATSNEYVYDMLRKMLIFHSENFGD